jgi:hypothetical protein
MKKVVALTAGFLVALAPAGTAFAGEPSGNAWGNCQNSASGGKQVLHDVSTLKNDSGLGGFGKDSKCEPVVGEEAPVKRDDTGTLPVLLDAVS